jgi:hypothetical protein
VSKGGTAARGNAAASLVATTREQTAGWTSSTEASRQKGLAMWTAEVVLLCALEVLGRSAASFPPIELVATAPANASPGVEAYVGPWDKKIYLVTTSAPFRRQMASNTRCGDVMAARKLASILIHEELHIRENASERTAYQAQLLRLILMGAGIGSPPYQEVFRAMQHTANRDRARVPVPATPAGLMASDTR